jgi:transcription antitermination factor NusG
MSGPWLIVRVTAMAHAGPRSMIQWLDNLGALGWESYYPMVREMRQVPRKQLSHAQRNSGVILMRPRVVPFLPSLVFVRENHDRPHRTRSLFDYPGVIGFIGFGAEPARISDALITGLRERERAGEGNAIPGGTPIEYVFRAGDEVEVLHGPFAYFRGIVEAAPDVPIERIDADTRLRLTLAFFGRQTPANVAVSDIRKL